MLNNERGEMSFLPDKHQLSGLLRKGLTKFDGDYTDQ